MIIFDSGRYTHHASDLAAVRPVHPISPSFQFTRTHDNSIITMLTGSKAVAN